MSDGFNTKDLKALEELLNKPQAWGEFPAKKGQIRKHVAPVTDEGYLLPPHELNRQCICKPFIDQHGWLVHNLIQVN